MEVSCRGFFCRLQQCQWLGSSANGQFATERCLDIPLTMSDEEVEVMETVTRTTKKKESFRWKTPTDEFADHVASDTDDEDNDQENDKMNGNTTDVSSNTEVIVVTEDFADDMESLMLIKKTKHNNKRVKKPPSGKKFPCPTCGKQWNWPWELRRHVMSHYKEKERNETSSFKCSECGKGFQWKRDLAQHMRLHTGEKLLVCSVCDKRFTTRQALLHHVVVHTGEKPFQCAFCDSSFTQPANLRTHMKKKHATKADIKGNKCPHCSEEFPSIIAVHQHMLEDHPSVVAAERASQNAARVRREQSRIAEEAKKLEKRRERESKRKAKKESSTEHSRGVKGLREWEVNYEFQIGDGLVKGVDWDRTPSQLSLDCELCDRKFSFRYEIMFHNLCHSFDENGMAKNRNCPECEASFRVPIGLKHHLIVHTDETPFLCLHCWRSFASHVDLKLHVKKEHLFDDDPLVKNDKKKENKKEIFEESKGLDEEKSYQTKEGKSSPLHRRQATAYSMDSTQTSAISTTPTAEILTNASTTDVEMADAGVAETHYALLVDENGSANFGTRGDQQQTLFVQQMSDEGHEQQQNMIVVIQSDDLENAAVNAADGSVIVVDSSQLQQVVSTDGMPVTVVHTQSDPSGTGDGLEHALLIATDHSEAQKVIIAEDSGRINEEPKELHRHEDPQQEERTQPSQEERLSSTQHEPQLLQEGQLEALHLEQQPQLTEQEHKLHLPLREEQPQHTQEEQLEELQEQQPELPQQEQEPPNAQQQEQLGQLQQSEQLQQEQEPPNAQQEQLNELKYSEQLQQEQGVRQQDRAVPEQLVEGQQERSQGQE